MPRARARLCLLASIPALVAGMAQAADSWTVEEASRIGFTAFQQGQPVQGAFDTWQAEVAFDPERLEASRIVVEIDVASVNTGHRDRDDTLRSSQFFDAGRWPSARFASERLVEVGEGRYEAEGTLTIRDVTQEVALPFELAIGTHPEDADRLLAEAAGELTISRAAFGVGQGDWSSTGQIGEDVIVRIEIAATRPR